MLTLAWEVEERVKVTAACLTFYRQLMSDEARLMTLFGKTPGLEEITYLRKSILRFNGDAEKASGYLKDVADIESKGDTLGQPPRELIISRLDEFGLDKRKATQSIREEYHKRRNEEAKAEYERTKKQKEKEAAKGG